MITNIVWAFVVSIGLVFGLSLMHVGRRLLRGDANEYRRNQSRVRSLKNVIRGEVPNRYDGTRDDRVAAGIAVDLKTNRWVEQGRLSDEALQDVLAP